jgi:hypothetical protein
MRRERFGDHPPSCPTRLKLDRNVEGGVNKERGDSRDV